MSDIASPLARSKGEIVFNAGGAEVLPGSSDAVAVRLVGFTLLQNGNFKIVATYTHPNPPPPSMRRCKTINGALPASEPIPDAEQDAEIAGEDSERIEPGLDPPALAPNESSPAAVGRTARLITFPPPRNSMQAAVPARARRRPLLPTYAVRLSARRGDAPHGQTRPFRLTDTDIQALVAHATRLEAGR